MKVHARCEILAMGEIFEVQQERSYSIVQQWDHFGRQAYFITRCSRDRVNWRMTNCMLSSAQEPALHLQFAKPFMGTMAVGTENTHALKTYVEDHCLQS